MRKVLWSVLVVALLPTLLISGSSFTESTHSTTVADHAYAFGDSVTWGFVWEDGVWTIDRPKTWCYLTCSHFNWSVSQNFAQGGYRIADIAAGEIYPQAVPNTINSLGLISYNDSADSNLSIEERRMLYGLISYLTIPNANKVFANSNGVNYSGTWTDPGFYAAGGRSKQSTQQNAYVEFSLTGEVLYIGLTGRQDIVRGNYQIVVDGVEQATGSCSFSEVVGNYHKTFAPFGVRIAGLANITHTVRVTVTSSGNPVCFDWAGSNLNAWSYNSYFYIGGSICHLTDRSSAELKNAVMSDVAATLLWDGLRVRYVDVLAYWNENTDLGNDGVHPNTLGMSHISEAFIANVPLPWPVDVGQMNAASHLEDVQMSR
jgi:hypothetical protein